MAQFLVAPLPGTTWFRLVMAFTGLTVPQHSVATRITTIGVASCPPRAAVFPNVIASAKLPHGFGPSGRDSVAVGVEVSLSLSPSLSLSLGPGPACRRHDHSVTAGAFVIQYRWHSFWGCRIRNGEARRAVE